MEGKQSGEQQLLSIDGSVAQRTGSLQGLDVLELLLNEPAGFENGRDS